MNDRLKRFIDSERASVGDRRLTRACNRERACVRKLNSDYTRAFIIAGGSHCVALAGELDTSDRSRFSDLDWSSIDTSVND